MAAPKYIALVSGFLKQITAAVTSTADSVVATDGTGKIDSSFLPAGLGVDTITATASEAISAGAFVDLYLAGGVLKARNADASTTGKFADGFALSAISSGASGSITLAGQNNSLSALTIGSDYWLDPAVPGGATATPPSTSGQTSQYLGVALSAAILDFHKVPPVLL